MWTRSEKISGQAGLGASISLGDGALEDHARAYPERGAVVVRLQHLLSGSAEPFSRHQIEPGHFTASAFVVSPERQRVLLIHHAKLRRWLQPGGHVERTDADLRAAALREAREETGVVGLDELTPGIFDVDIHVIPGSSKESGHLHFDVRYAFLAHSDRLLASSEVQEARWVALEAVHTLTTDASVLRCVDRLRSLV
jgi:8-oxo-dGTP pyrophosphatase MutT (NUDIX family)